MVAEDRTPSAPFVLVTRSLPGGPEMPSRTGTLGAPHPGLKPTRDDRTLLWRISGTSMLLGSGLTLAFVTQVVLRVDPWYEPQYLIPLFGMIVGNAMNATALAAERLASPGRPAFGQLIGVEHTAGMVPFPVTFLLTDLLNEYYGKKAARRIAYLAFAMGALAFGFVALARALPILEGVPGTATQESFETIFGSASLMYVASLVAFVVAVCGRGLLAAARGGFGGGGFGGFGGGSFGGGGAGGSW